MMGLLVFPEPQHDGGIIDGIYFRGIRAFVFNIPVGYEMNVEQTVRRIAVFR
jgi:hypothetical protein